MVNPNFNKLNFLIYYSSHIMLSNLYCHTLREATTFWAKETYFKCMKQNLSRNANCITLRDMDQCSFLRTILLMRRSKWFRLTSGFHDKSFPPYLGLSTRFWHMIFWHSKSQAMVLWSRKSKYFHFLLYTLLATAVKATHKPTSPLPTPQLGNRRNT